MNITQQNMHKSEHAFNTQDIQLAACLVALGANIVTIDRDEPERCTFVFNDSSDLQQWVEGYWCKRLAVEPQTLLGALKAVKSRLYNASL